MAENETIDDVLREGPGPFEAGPTYSPVGDCVEVFFEDSDHYAERVDCWLTIYRSFETKRLVGFEIKNVATLLSKFDLLGLDCRVTGTKCAIRLEAFFACLPYVEPTVAQAEPYRNITGHVIRSNQAFELTPVCT